MAQRRNRSRFAAKRAGRGNEALFSMVVRPPDWTEGALCAQTDPEAFFPDKGESNRAAKATCLRCEVRAECLAYALANDERFGVWGGKSERERRAIGAATRAVGTSRRKSTREFDAEVARLTEAGYSLAAIASYLECRPRSVSRARARLKARTTTTTATTATTTEFEDEREGRWAA